MDYEFEQIISSIAYGRARAAESIGVSVDEMKAVGRLAAFEANESWEPDGGRTLTSWVWLNVQWDIGRQLHREAAQFAEQLGDDDPPDDDGEDFDTVIMVRRALDYLRAELSNPDWTMLWLLHAEGRTYSEIAGDLGITPECCRQRAHRASRKAVTILRSRDIAEIGDRNERRD